MKRRFLILWFFLNALQNPAFSAVEDSARVTVTALIASNQGSDFNLTNDAYRDRLIKLFSYTAYEQTFVSSESLKRTERNKIALDGGYELVLTLLGIEKERMTVQALIRKGADQYVDTVLSIMRPGVVFLGGPPVGEGVLIIVLETGF